MTKSLLRHILTAVGSILVFLGLFKFTGLIDILVQNLDVVWDAVTALIGFVLAVWGFFKDRPADFKNT
jgi:RNAse (barnase) inhibitor barstar